MIYITFKRRPFPCMSVKLRILPTDILFKLIVVACPSLGFLVLALIAIPINGAVTLIAGFKTLFQAVCVPLNNFCILL